MDSLLSHSFPMFIAALGSHRALMHAAWADQWMAGHYTCSREGALAPVSCCCMQLGSNPKGLDERCLLLLNSKDKGNLVTAEVDLSSWMGR